MTLIATAVGALVALLPKPLLHPKGDRPNKANPVQSPAESEIARLTRSNRQLVNHIESLEREILLERHLCAHWKEAAQRLAKQSRETREAQENRERAAAAQGLQAYHQQHNPFAQQMQAHQLQQQAAHAQQNPQQAQLAHYADMQQSAFGGFCNCVPSRAQVWAENREPFAVLRP